MEGDDPRIYDDNGKVVGIKAGKPPKWGEIIGKFPTIKMTLREDPNITVQVQFYNLLIQKSLNMSQGKIDLINLYNR